MISALAGLMEKFVSKGVDTNSKSGTSIGGGSESMLAILRSGGLIPTINKVLDRKWKRKEVGS